jgi:hypothetical protein
MDDAQAKRLRELATSDNPSALIRGVTRGQVLALLDEREALRRERDEAVSATKIAYRAIGVKAQKLGAAMMERDAAMALLRQARYFVESDVAMMDAISRHAPLPFEDQARHDATEYPSERLLKRIDALLGDGGEGR